MRGIYRTESASSRLLTIVGLLVLVAVLAIVCALPVAAQPMYGVNTRDSCASHDKATVPLCCITTDCAVSSASMVNMPASTSRLNLKVVYILSIQDCLIQYSLLNPGNPQTKYYRECLPPISDFRCRSCLTSEEPPLTWVHRLAAAHCRSNLSSFHSLSLCLEKRQPNLLPGASAQHFIMLEIDFRGDWPCDDSHIRKEIGQVSIKMEYTYLITIRTGEGTWNYIR